jgi:hypothetical protein
MSDDIKQMANQERVIIRKDLDSFGFMPTGIGIQMISQHDKNLAMALFIEAVYVQIFKGKKIDNVVEYLQGPLQVKEGMDIYLIQTALRIRRALARSNGNGKLALEDVMNDKGAEIELVKLLLSTCHNLSHEYKIPYDKILPIDEEVLNAQKTNWTGCVIKLVLLL